MSYLLDTCILSKLRRLGKESDQKLEDWIKKHDESSFFISALTIGEIQSGINKLNLKNSEERKKRLILEDWLNESLIPRFQDRILAIDIQVGLAWGKFFGESKKKGVIIPVVDGLIAASAIVHNLTLVTENIDDFIHTGVNLFNPWLTVCGSK